MASRQVCNQIELIARKRGLDVSVEYAGGGWARWVRNDVRQGRNVWQLRMPELRAYLAQAEDTLFKADEPAAETKAEWLTIREIIDRTGFTKGQVYIALRLKESDGWARRDDGFGAYLYEMPAGRLDELRVFIEARSARSSRRVVQPICEPVSDNQPSCEADYPSSYSTLKLFARPQARTNPGSGAHPPLEVQHHAVRIFAEVIDKSNQFYGMLRALKCDEQLIERLKEDGRALSRRRRFAAQGRSTGGVDA